MLTRVDPNAADGVRTDKAGRYKLTAACLDDASGGHEGVSLVDFWRAFDSNLLENRH